MKGLDTNVLIRYLTQDDPKQSRAATAWIEKSTGKGQRCYINAIVLCELVWVLKGAYGHDKADIVMVLEKMLSTVEFSIEDRDSARHALDDYKRGSGDFADYFIGWRNRKARCDETVTFDRGLKKNELFKLLERGP